MGWLVGWWFWEGLDWDGGESKLFWDGFLRRSEKPSYFGKVFLVCWYNRVNFGSVFLGYCLVCV